MLLITFSKVDITKILTTMNLIMRPATDQQRYQRWDDKSDFESTSFMSGRSSVPAATLRSNF